MEPGSRFILVVHLAVAVACCAEDAPDEVPSPVETMDSAGVLIVATDTSAISDRPRLAAEPEWSISEVTLGHGTAPLHEIRDVARVGPGRIAISHGSTTSVFVGEPLSDDEWVELGRRGEGPSEMLDVRSLDVAGDTVRVLDPRRGRVLSFLDSGDFLGAHELPSGAREDLLLWSPFGATEAVVHLSFVPEAPSDSTLRGTGPLFVRRGESWDSVTSVSGVESFRIPSLGGEAPAGARTHIAGTSEGLWIGDNARAELVRVSSTGGPDLIVRWPPDTSRDPAEESRAAIEAQIAEFQKTSDPAPGDLSLLRSIPPSRGAPQFTGLVAGEDGSVWIGPYEAGLGWMWNPFRDGGQWMVLSPGGIISELVSLPDRFEPFAISEGRVIGVRRDELDVEWLEAYRIIPGGPH